MNGPVRIAILRDPHRAEALRAALQADGFEVVVRPVTRIVFQAPRTDEDWAALTRQADWVVFTSRNGVEHFACGLGGMAALADLLREGRVAVLGTAALQQLRQVGVEPEVTETRAGSAELAGTLLWRLKPRSHVLYPSSAEGLAELSDALTRAGHEVCRLTCYATVPLAVEDRQPLDWRSFDAAVLAAPSAVAALAEEPSLPERFPIVAIGPTTAAALRERGMTVLDVAATPDVAGIVSVLEVWSMRFREGTCEPEIA